MSVRSFLVRLSWKAAAVAAFAWAGSSASAADVVPPAPPVTVTAAPVTVGDPGCASCQTCAHGVKGHCNVCDKWLKSKKAPFPVTLCPGACFGYFQTQWRKWDEVCPYPYLGQGVSDAAKTPGSVTSPRPGELGQPRSVDPKMPDPKKVGSVDLPAIPAAVVAPAVPNKFAR